MTDENKSDGNGEVKKPEQPNPEVMLVIKYNRETGAMSVQGPGNGQLYDEPLCDWLMKKASRHIEVSNARASQSSIIQPKPRMKDIFRRR